MSVTGIIAFIVFLLIANVLDKKKKKAGRQKLPPHRRQMPPAGGVDCELPLPGRQEEQGAYGADWQGETAWRLAIPLPDDTSLAAEDRIYRELQAQLQEDAAFRRGMPEAFGLGEMRQEAGRGRRESVRARSGSAAQEQEAAEPSVLEAFGLALKDLPHAVVLAEIIGRPKSQRRRNPYFRP